MYKYIIFSELCPPEHNPRRQNANAVGWELGLGDKRRGLGIRYGVGRSFGEGDSV